MANGNTLYLTDLPGSKRINMFLSIPPANIQKEATCVVLRLICYLAIAEMLRANLRSVRK